MTETLPAESPYAPGPMPASASISCPSCQNPISAGPQFGPVARECPSCRKKPTVRVFPRLFVPEESKPAFGELSTDGDATCSFYPELKAEHVCEECGCFMSEKASISWGGKSLCLPCLHSLREKKGKDEFRASLKLYDNTALGLVVPFLAFFPLAFITLFTAPAALYYLIRYRKSSLGLVPRGPFRWWLALFFAIVVNGAWIFLIISWIGLIANGLSS